MTTTHRTANASRTGLIRRPTKAERLGHALVLAEARRLADGGHTPDDRVTSSNIALTEETATPLAAAIVATLDRHHIDTGDLVIRAAVGTLAVEAARHIEPGHAAAGRPWRQGSTAIAACANALYAADVNLYTVGTERALQSLADAVAARTLADQPAAPAAAVPAPRPAASAEAGTVDAADLLTGRSTAERTKSTIMNTTALGVAASLVAAVVYGAGLLDARPAPVLAAGIGAVVLALVAVAVLIIAVFPRPGTATPASADELKAAAEHQAGDPAARADAAAAEGAALLRVNAAKARLIRVAMFVLLAAAATAAAAVLIETL